MSPLSTRIYLGLGLAAFAAALPATETGPASALSVPCSTTGASSTCGLHLNTAGSSVVLSTSGGSTFSQTFYGTSLKGFETLTAATTVTTVDTAGETIVAVVLAAGAAGGAAGLAWLAVPKVVPGAPVITAPTTPPELPTSQAAPTTKTIPSSSSSSSSAAPSATASELAHSEPGFDINDLKTYPIPGFIYSDSLVCGYPGSELTLASDFVEPRIKDFCKSNNGKLADSAGITQLWFTKPGVLLNITISQVPSCANTHEQEESTIDEDDCNIILKETLDSCDKQTTTNKLGGSVEDGCLLYKVQPVINEGELTCDGPRPKGFRDLAGTGANRDESMDNRKAFCKLVTGTKLSKDRKAFWYDYRPRQGNSYVTFAVDYTQHPDCDSYTADAQSCERLMAKTIDGCDTKFRGNAGKFGGHVNDGCGVYKMLTNVSEVFTCGYNNYANPVQQPVSSDLLRRAIDDYCSKDLKMLPSYSPKKFYQSLPDKVAVYEYKEDKGPKIIMTTYADDEIQRQAPQGTTCNDPTEFSIKDNDCKRKMLEAASQCSSSNAGWLNDNSANGCIIWNWAAVNS